jgi:hypothetical protein
MPLTRDRHEINVQGDPTGKRVTCPLCGKLTTRTKSDSVSRHIHCEPCEQDFWICPLITEYNLVWFTRKE